MPRFAARYVPEPSASTSLGSSAIGFANAGTRSAVVIEIAPSLVADVVLADQVIERDVDELRLVLVVARHEQRDVELGAGAIGNVADHIRIERRAGARRDRHERPRRIALAKRDDRPVRQRRPLRVQLLHVGERRSLAVGGEHECALVMQRRELGDHAVMRGLECDLQLVHRGLERLGAKLVGVRDEVRPEAIGLRLGFAARDGEQP